MRHIAALSLLLVSLVPTARAVSPSLSGISPSGGKAGTDVELTLSGARLEDAKELMWYSPGIQVISLEAKKGGTAKAMIRIQPDCRMGEHQVRLRTLSGLTELRTFIVSPFMVMKETEPNNDPGKAQVVPVNSTVIGTITAEDVDQFKVQGRKGERLSAEVEAMRLGRVMFDAYLAILDPDGVQIAESDDSLLFLQDPFLSILAPKDGFYRILVRDTSWGGGNDFNYRLHLGNFPRPTSTFPIGGEAGKDLTLTFLGDPSGPIQKTVGLPKEGPGELGVFCETAGVMAPSANRIRVSPFPNVLESQGNQDRSTATLSTLSLPLAFNGIISKPAESDWFGFTARRKQALEITVWARRLRSPLDPVLDLVDSKGRVLESNDDSAGPDSVIKFTPEDDGMLYLRIRDQLKQGGPDFAYRIEITPPAPSVTLSIPEVARNDTQTRQSVSVPRGNRMATLIQAKRANFSGELRFQIPNLPSGVELHSEAMPGGVDSLPWVFTAASDASMAGALVEASARATKDGTQPASRYRHRLELIRGNNDQVYYATHSDRLAVAVVQEVPFRLNLDTPAVPLVRAGSMKLRVSAERRPGFDEPITVKMLWNPPGVSSETEVVIPKGKTSAEYTVNAKGDAAIAAWKIVVLGSAPSQGGTIFASSDLTPLRITEPFLIGKIATAVTEPGKPVQIKCTLELKEPFEGSAKVKLVGLPEKATTAEQEITSKTREIVFDVVLDPKIPTGSHKNLSCQIQIRKGGDTLVQSVGNGGILRIVPPKKGAPEPKKLASTEGKAALP